MSAANLDDTSRCPVGHRCESCGAERDDLAVETAAAARLGVMCLTRCAGGARRSTARSRFR